MKRLLLVGGCWLALGGTAHAGARDLPDWVVYHAGLATFALLPETHTHRWITAVGIIPSRLWKEQPGVYVANIRVGYRRNPGDPQERCETNVEIRRRSFVVQSTTCSAEFGLAGRRGPLYPLPS